MAKALVIGGTGPSGPHVVEGLLDRGFDVTIAHSGQHEASYSRDVEHLHGDVHFKDHLETLVGRRTFDVAVLMYGRLRHSVAVLSARCSHLVAVGTALGTTAQADRAEWGPIGRPLHVDEKNHIPVSADEGANKLKLRMLEAEEALFSSAERGGAGVTYVGYPRLYGPRQPGPLEWSIVRRVLDGRTEFVLPDGGLKLETRGYVENVAHALLLCVDRPDVSFGKKYFVGDDAVHTIKQRIEFIARLLGHTFQFVDMPYLLAAPSWPLWRHSAEHSVRSTAKIRNELGYRDVVPAPEALSRTVGWLVANRPSDEDEAKLGDAFDYAAEDKLIDAWRSAQSRISSVSGEPVPPGHIYRHPRAPGESWFDGRQQT